MRRQHTWWQRLVAQGGACTAAVVLGLLALATPPRAAAVVLSVTGQGGAVPDGSPTGITFDITIPPNAGIIASSGNNVTLSLIGFTHTLAFDLTFMLEHVGFGSAQFLLDRPLDRDTIVCFNDFIDGTYRFTSEATTTIQDILQYLEQYPARRLHSDLARRRHGQRDVQFLERPGRERHLAPFHS